eukprot:CAMPEP_0114995454 /NCGR_PEP_ID=MMETSP0216-20121206/13740_1 /TAXON_ID=223996 /ORGANISM="Protocruzia adherens, Strain Boccale" /LENGTH=147 /DNA_ID=CAMNT_0002359501 /DNA_START=706 /DNA_END=1149 /DNA_ORIENTATION=+
MAYYFSFTTIFTGVLLGLLALDLKIDYHDDRNLTLKYYEAHNSNAGPFSMIIEIIVLFAAIGLIVDVIKRKNSAFFLILLMSLGNLYMFLEIGKIHKTMNYSASASSQIAALNGIRAYHLYLALLNLVVLVLSILGSAKPSRKEKQS